MKLLTQELIDQLPKIYEQDGKNGDAIIYIKYFTPDSSFTWYVLEGQPAPDIKGDYEEFEFFGIVDSGNFKEYGYFVLSELEKGRGSLGLPIERDLYFKPCKVSEVRELKELWE